MRKRNSYWCHSFITLFKQRMLRVSPSPLAWLWCATYLKWPMVHSCLACIVAGVGCAAEASTEPLLPTELPSGS